MKLNESTGCRIILIGLLKEVPQLQMDEQGNLTSKLLVITQAHQTNKKTNWYHVIVFGDAALRVKQFGFPNLRLWIEGKIELLESINYIIAEKIAFLMDSEPCASLPHDKNIAAVNSALSHDLHFLESKIANKQCSTLQ